MENTKPLYHYTSQRGLLGILESKKLWMTNILYLNDSSEFIYTWELVKPELSKRKKLFEVLRTIGKEKYSNIDEKNIIHVILLSILLINIYLRQEYTIMSFHFPLKKTT